VIGVASESQEKNDRFAKSLDLTYRLLGDPKGELAKTYGVVWPLIRIAHRATFVIDRDRRILLAYKNERDVDSHIARAAATLGVSV
jgi:peroxiredoxin